jgi:Uri superfamily endonuclease
VPLVGFGASDCHCRAHLFYVAHRPPFAWGHRLQGADTVGRTVLTGPASHWA